MTNKTLQQLWDEHDGRLIDKWAHYLPIYERYFAKFRGTHCNLIEIGVAHGGSLQLWKKYLGPQAWIAGIDVDERCRAYEETNITIHIKDQAKLTYPPETAPWIDIVIDDGSHVLADQQASLDVLWPLLSAGGVYLIEDCHYASQIPEFPEGSLVTRYPWIWVFERPKRIVTGKPSRPLNNDEKQAYGALNAQYLHPNL